MEEGDDEREVEGLRRGEGTVRRGWKIITI